MNTPASSAHSGEQGKPSDRAVKHLRDFLSHLDPEDDEDAYNSIEDTIRDLDAAHPNYRSALIQRIMNRMNEALDACHCRAYTSKNWPGTFTLASVVADELERKHEQDKPSVAQIIAAELARIDGYEPEDENGGLYDVRWSGGPNPEPEGDAWNMDYLPKGARIARELERSEALERKHEQSEPVGEVVVTRDAAGAIVAVTRQDSEGRILSTIATAPPPSEQAGSDRLADTQRAIIEAAECRGYERAKSELAHPAPEAQAEGELVRYLGLRMLNIAYGHRNDEANEDAEAAIIAMRPQPSASETPGAKDAVEYHGLDTPERVCFYEQDFYVLSNFSSFTVEYAGIRFATSEHAYHWMKFEGTGNDSIKLSIENAPSAHEAFKLAERFKSYRRPGWDAVKVDVMRIIIRAKAEQHEYVRRKVLATGDRELVENSWRDDFWGWGPNRDGQNMLGKLWMEVRAELRAAIAAQRKEVE